MVLVVRFYLKLCKFLHCMFLASRHVLSSKIILKKFVLQNLSFLPTTKINFLTKTLLYYPKISSVGLTPYLDLFLFFIQPYNSTHSIFVKLHHLNLDYFQLRNLKLFTPTVSNKFFTFYFCGNDSSWFASRTFGFFNKLFRSFAAYTDIFFCSWISNIFFIGVGYKVFIFNKYLYLRLGFSRMLKILIPSGITVMTRKRNHLRVMSSSHEQLESFLYLLKNLRTFDCYKGKGIFQTADFSTVKLKVGKKQQFF